MRTATWYFDVVSPFAYLHLARFRELPRDLAIEYRPVLFAGLLGHWGQKGPAEIPGKRRYIYRYCHWYARRLGVPFRFPAGHPFNPLAFLRLILAADCSRKSVNRVFSYLWSGADPGDAAGFRKLAEELNVSPDAIERADVKERLRRNTEEAVAAGVFGVPTLALEGELFWGADSVEFFSDWYANPVVLANDEMRRLDALPVAAARRQ